MERYPQGFPRGGEGEHHIWNSWQWFRAMDYWKVQIFVQKNLSEPERSVDPPDQICTALGKWMLNIAPGEPEEQDMESSHKALNPLLHLAINWPWPAATQTLRMAKIWRRCWFSSWRGIKGGECTLYFHQLSTTIVSIGAGRFVIKEPKPNAGSTSTFWPNRYEVKITQLGDTENVLGHPGAPGGLFLWWIHLCSLNSCLDKNTVGFLKASLEDIEQHVSKIRDIPEKMCALIEGFDGPTSVSA